MNSSALVDRLNFAYALTNSRFANQKFDSPHLLALALLSGPSLPTETGTGAPHRAVRVGAQGNGPGCAASGSEIALNALEGALLAGHAKPETNLLIRKQVKELSATQSSPVDTLNVLTALILGSPDFQLR